MLEKVVFTDRSKRYPREKGSLAVELVDQEGEFLANLWTLPKKSCTPEVLKALNSAFKEGHDRMKWRAANLLRGLE